MSLQIDVFDDPEELLRQTDERTVFPSRFALGEALRRKKAVFWGNEPRTMPELWRDLAERVGVESPGGDLLFRERLREQIKELPLLRALAEDDLEELAAHLQALRREIPGQFVPTNELEEELGELLRVPSEATWHEEILQRAESLPAEKRQFVMLPAPSRQWGRLLLALAEKSEVQVLLLLSRETLEPYLRLAGLEGEGASEHFVRSGALPFGEPGRADVDVRLLRGTATTALQSAPDALVAPSPFSNWQEFLRPSREQGLPFSFRTALGVRDSFLGSKYLGGEGDLEELLQAEAVLERDLVWQDALRRECEALGERQPPRSVLLQSVWGPRTWRGQGPRMLSVGEAAAAAPETLVFWGLDADRYPLPPAPSLFFSAELLDKYPELRARDRRPAFVAALLAAREKIVLVASSEEEPSSFFLECERVWGPAEEAEDALSSAEQFRTLARSGARTPRLCQIDERLAEAEPGRPEGRVYSVTELETFLRCPLGWFVSYRIRPKLPPSPESERGIALHRALEEVFALPPERRRDALLDVLPERFADWQERLEVVLDRWPGQGDMMLEVPLEATLPFEDGEVVLRGRADRIDSTEEGILLFDWKTGSLPLFDGNNLQAALYPILAAQRLHAEPLGFLYVSLRTGEHRGSLARPLLPDIKTDWHKFSSAAISKAEEAIRRIEAGEWRTVGSRCPPWCGHRLLSGVSLG